MAEEHPPTAQIAQIAQTAPTDLQNRLKLLPAKSGVYIFRCKKEQVLYIGKAKILRSRVRSYFQSAARDDPRCRHFVGLVQQIDWLITPNEAEAILLEDKLIKLHKPKYNIRLKDQKSYPYLKLSMGDLYPRLSITRILQKDGSLYFGPYPVMREAVSLVRAIQKYFPLRLSKFELDGTKKHTPCLNYHIKKCLAPCAQKVDPGEYAQLVEAVRLLLYGKAEQLIHSLHKDMESLSARLRFEEAAVLRDRLSVARRLLGKRKRVTESNAHYDILSLHRSSGVAGLQMFFIRSGSLLGTDFLFFKNGDDYSNEDMFRAALARLYLHQSSILAREILISEPLDDVDILASFLEEEYGIAVPIACPKRGERYRLMQMCLENAKENLQQRLSERESHEALVAQTQQQLRLSQPPLRAECFDVSHTSGQQTVATMSVLINGQPQSSEYKKFKIKTVGGNDDFASMYEALSRRCQRGLSGDWPWPQLLIIDGGKGQLGIAERVLKDLGIKTPAFDLIALAKGRSEKRRSRRAGGTSNATTRRQEELDYEYVVKPNQKNPIPLRKNSAALHFLQRIRDEAHRTAIGYHRSLRGKRMQSSKLDQIPYIGTAKRNSLLRAFGSLKRIGDASEEQLAATPLISSGDAKRIYAFFHPESAQPDSEHSPAKAESPR